MRPFRTAILLISGAALLGTAIRYGTRDPEAEPASPTRQLDEARLLLDLDQLTEEEKKAEGHAWEVFEWWYGTRAYPNELIPKRAFYDAFVYARDRLSTGGARGAASDWVSIGPDNVGGRMLALAFDPVNSDVIWAGAASGGLWRSTSAGEGSSAWTRIETGFPSLSVSAIVIDPNDPAIMFIGTGEISRYERPLVGTPGARSSYGLGVLKSVDGGATWEETGLTWTFDQSRAVIALKMDPKNSQRIWAATSEGLYLTQDGGESWHLAHSVLMAMDVVVDPLNSNRVWVSHGQLNSTPNPGIYRTTDGGVNWVQLTSGLPASDFGRTPLAVSETLPVILYAGVSNAATRQVVGLYKSTNLGNSWTNTNGTNWAGGQAWYDNSVAVSPTDPNLVICAGLDTYRTTNGGPNLDQVSFWYLGYEGQVPPGGDEGPPDYVHADQHAILFDPNDADIVYIACDGGIFKSEDRGVTWAGKNGGLVTTQFYAGFANGAVTPTLALGGLQDNGTVKYLGTPSWSKVFGGDGGWCAIDPRNENVLYEEYVNLNMHKSTNGGDSWFEIHSGSGDANFIAPFVLSESEPDVLYAGMKSVQKTTNGGSSWFFPDGNSNWNGTPMAVIGVAFTDPDTVIAATGSGTTGAVFEVRRSTNGGQTWTNVTAGLPNRYPTDIGFSPNDSRIAWLTFSGYGTPHVFRSTNAGLTWTDRSANLPDIPVQSVALDPANADWVYLGTDLGVFRSLDGGASWEDWNAGLPIAMVLDLAIRGEDRRMRAATFGNGVWEMVLPAASGLESSLMTDARAISSFASEGNPFVNATTLRFSLARRAEIELEIFDALGRRVRALASGSREGEGAVLWDGCDESGLRVNPGVYFARLTALGQTRTLKLTALR